MSFDFFHQHFFGKQPVAPAYDHTASLATVNAMAAQIPSQTSIPATCKQSLPVHPIATVKDCLTVQPVTAAQEIYIMATAPVVAAPTENKFETFLSTAAKDVEKILNAGINIAVAEQPLMNQILPANVSSAEAAAVTLIKNVMLKTEASYAAIGATVSYAQKVAEVVAITSTALVQILAGVGVTAGQSELTTLVTGATAFGNLQTSGLTTLTPTPAAALIT